MSDDQDGCEWVNVSSGTGLSRTTIVCVCVCVCVCVLTIRVLWSISRATDSRSGVAEVVEYLHNVFA